METFCEQKAKEFEIIVQDCVNFSIVKNQVTYEQLRKNKAKFTYKPVYDFMMNPENIHCMHGILDLYHIKVFENANKSFANLAQFNGVEVAANFVASQIVIRRLKDVLTGDEFTMFGKKRMNITHPFHLVNQHIKYLVSL